MTLLEHLSGSFKPLIHHKSPKWSDTLYKTSNIQKVSDNFGTLYIKVLKMNSTSIQSSLFLTLSKYSPTTKTCAMLTKQTWLLYVPAYVSKRGFLASRETDISINILLENALYFTEFTISDKLFKNGPSKIAKNNL